jgi:hypothetical protein
MESTMRSSAARPAAPLPAIDLEYRPATYFGPNSSQTVLLARVLGFERRELIRQSIEHGIEVPAPILRSRLSQSLRDYFVSLGPTYLGGEFLPALRPGEIEIARVSLATVTADQISVRATRQRRGIRYRIVDEFGEGAAECPVVPEASEHPLTLEELVGLIDGARDKGGLVVGHLADHAASSPTVGELLSFVRADSEFYPDLHKYFVGRVAAWVAAHSLRRQTVRAPD